MWANENTISTSGGEAFDGGTCDEVVVTGKRSEGAPKYLYGGSFFSESNLSSLDDPGWDMEGSHGHDPEYERMMQERAELDRKLGENFRENTTEGTANVVTAVNTSAVSLKQTWRLIGKDNRQSLAYAIQQTSKLHGGNLKPSVVKPAITSGLKVAGKVAGVASAGVTFYQAYNDFKEGEVYSAGARVAVWGVAAGATAIPVVGWGVAIGIGVADIIWGEEFYDWVETTMSY